MPKWLVIVCASIMFVALACSSGPPPTPTPGPIATPELPAGSVEHRVEVKDFTHQSLTIKVGESVLWIHREANNVLHSAVHTTRERDQEEVFSSPNMQRNESSATLLSRRASTDTSAEFIPLK